MNRAASNESLHPSLRDSLALCERVRVELLDTVASLRPTEWSTRRKNGVWTVSESVHHLILAEIGTSKMVRRMIRGDFRGVTKPDAAPLHDSRLDRYPYGRYPAPAGLIPSHLALPEAIERLDASHQRFVQELLQFQGPDADALASEDPDTGLWFSLAGWVRLQGLHEAHHLQHIKTLLPVR